MNCEWTLVTAPTSEPITLAQAKEQARITHDSEDDLLLSYIATAREQGELYMGRGFLTQTWKLTLDEFAEIIWLPMAAPLQSVTSVQYYDSDGTLQTLASSYYVVDTTSQPGRIVRAANMSWPSTHPDRLSGRVVITYIVGWATEEAVPSRIKQGIKLYVTALDADRSGDTVEFERSEQAAKRCWSDRVVWLPPLEYCA